MRIDETKIFLFTFKTDQGDVSFPMRAETKEEAGQKMQQTLGRMAAELAIDFPKVHTSSTASVEPEAITKTMSTSIPPEVLEMRINTLLGDMGASELKEKAKSETIKLWTGYDFKETNYPRIITELELIRTGQKEVPTKKK